MGDSNTPETDYSAAYIKSTPVDPDWVVRSNRWAQQAQQAQQPDTATQLAIQAQQTEQAKQAEAASQQAEAARQANISAQNTQIKSMQDQANAVAGQSIYGITADQQTADAQAISNQQAPPPPIFGQPATPGMMANASPVASRGVSISSPAQKMQAAGGMMPSSQPPKINRAGPGPQTGMTNSAMPSQEQPLRFGGA